MPEFVFGSLQFDSPAREIIANDTGEVLPVLEFADREAKAGAYVAVMLSYEAAPAFDPVLAVHEPSDFPLAWAGDLRRCTVPRWRYMSGQLIPSSQTTVTTERPR